ncbi:YgcG family protein [Escherichia coli]|nr:YgcG family protein [Escherichia coli]EFB3691778.1 YgcG family protein [Escherichia coli]EFF7437646.1 YgcG family protein [Escherichia coli]EFH9793679.1 YgcG family protein [Escherichia coli]EFH9847786.1 YgcG family protein [Escherichia coli]
MRYFILMFTFVCSFVAAQPTIVPQLQQQVTDLTSSLNSQEKKELTHKLDSIFNNTQVQIAVLIVPTTKDETIEQYATRVFDNWRLGDAKRNDGILIIVAWSDRTVRIQVGYGLEEKVTDALAGDIIRSNMIPAFKQQKFAQGLELAINALNNQLTSQHQYPTNPSESESASSSDHYYFAIFWVFAVMFFPFWFFHQGSNFCRACKSGVYISAIYLLDLFLFSDKIFPLLYFPSFLLSPYLWSLPVYVYFRKEHQVKVIIQTTAVPVEAQVAADLAAVAVLLEVAAHPAAGNSTIKNASPEAGIFKSDKVSLMPGL